MALIWEVFSCEIADAGLRSGAASSSVMQGAMTDGEAAHPEPSIRHGGVVLHLCGPVQSGIPVRLLEFKSMWRTTHHLQLPFSVPFLSPQGVRCAPLAQAVLITC